MNKKLLPIIILIFLILFGGLFYFLFSGAPKKESANNVTIDESTQKKIEEVSKDFVEKWETYALQEKDSLSYIKKLEPLATHDALIQIMSEKINQKVGFKTITEATSVKINNANENQANVEVQAKKQNYFNGKPGLLLLQKINLSLAKYGDSWKVSNIELPIKIMNENKTDL